MLGCPRRLHLIVTVVATLTGVALWPSTFTAAQSQSDTDTTDSSIGEGTPNNNTDDDLLGDIDNPHLARELPPAARVSVPVAIESAIEFLVTHQNKNGSFGKKTSGRDYEIMASIPGSLTAFEVASSALCWMGLREAATANEKYDTEASKEARRTGLRFLVEKGRVRRATPLEMYNIWALSYALQALAMALDHNEYESATVDATVDATGDGTTDDGTTVGGTAEIDASHADADPENRATEARVRATMQAIFDALALYQCPDGGWTYYDFNVGAYRPSDSAMTFVTGTVLVAVAAAQKHGFHLPQKVTDKALRSIVRCRTPESSYLYGTYLQYGPHRGINRPKGSAMRNPVCDWVLHDVGKIDDQVLVDNMKVFRKQHRFSVAALRRPIPHESWYQVSGYFYLYGHMYAAMVLERLPEEKRLEHWSIVIEGTLKSRQKDGSYWDYPLYGYHKFYGTGMALFALSKSPQA